MAVRLSTPYYLAGTQKRRYHTQHGEKAAFAAGALGAAAYGAKKNPQVSQVAAGMANNFISSRSGVGVQIPVHTVEKGLGVAAGATAAYSAYHFGRAARYKQLENRRTKAYYMRKQNNKMVRVKKGKRKSG